MDTATALRALSRFAALLLERLDDDTAGDLRLLGEAGLSVDAIVRGLDEHEHGWIERIGDDWSDVRSTVAELVACLHEQVDELACEDAGCARSAERVGGCGRVVPLRGARLPVDQ